LFKIDKSSVEFIDSNKSAVVIKYWTAQNNRFDEHAPEPLTALKEKKSMPEAAEDIKNREKDFIDPSKIIEQAYAEADKIKASAWEEGYNHGLNEAKKILENFIRLKAEEIRQSLQEIKAFQEEIVTELEECALQLSFDIAEKIVNIQMEKDDIVFIGIVKKAIEKLNAREKFTLRLNETQFEKYFQGGPDWLMEEMQCVPFTALKDPGVAPYGCVVESEDAIIDAGVNNQLKMLQRTLGREDSQNDEAP
jgi:flagellar biosynthesis/type III secretory pathway protein FliH